MKIVIFSSYFLPHKGGVEFYVWQTAKRLVKRGHKVWVVTSRLPGMKKREKIEGIQVIRLPALEILRDQFPVQLSLAADVRKEISKADAVITHTRFYPLTLAAGMYAHAKGIPWLHIEHGSKQVDYTNPVVLAGSRVFDATAGRWILSHSKVAGISKASCRFAKRLGARKCDILYNGVDAKFFGGKKKKHKGITIAYIGRLIKEKGVHDLLKAVKGLDARVIVIGKGPYSKELKKLGGKFVGEKSPSQIRDILAGCDILVNPSYAEGLPTSVLEGGAMGLAVVATDVGGTKEVIDDGKNGYLIRPGNVKVLRQKIQSLIKNEKRRNRFGKSLQKKVREKFDWKSIVVKMEKVLKSL
jgi:glycosyltransferase involved in cell wall biosynthesis